jgi:hypothetical protein
MATLTSLVLKSHLKKITGPAVLPCQSVWDKTCAIQRSSTIGMPIMAKYTIRSHILRYMPHLRGFVMDTSGLSATPLQCG